MNECILYSIKFAHKHVNTRRIPGRGDGGDGGVEN